MHYKGVPPSPSHFFPTWHIDRKKPPPLGGFVKETPTPGGVSFLGDFQTKNSEEEDPPAEQTQKLMNFGGCSSGGVLFLQVLGLETTQQGNPLGGGGFFNVPGALQNKRW